LILITTSDYLPKLGGLTTFTRNLEEVFNDLKIPYEIFHWNSPQDILSYDSEQLNKYELIINVHVMFCWLMPHAQEKMINFVHGSEVLMTSPHLLKKIFKQFQKKKYFSLMEKSFLNLFISRATRDKAEALGFSLDHSRDVIFHNCVPMTEAQFEKNTQACSKELIFTCIARNVPHKNLSGSIEFCENIQELFGKPVRLIVPKGNNLISSKICLEELSDEENETRNEAYRKAHYNLLLSLDHSKKGFYEGFGLTVLEAGQFGVPSIVFKTGGLPEAVHHGQTGYVISSTDKSELESIPTFKDEALYQLIRFQCYAHTIQDHSLSEYKLFFSRFLETRGAA